MSSATYQPPQEILHKYAQVLVNFALNSGAGVKPGEVVECAVPDVAKPLALELHNVILQSGAHPIMRILPTGFDKDFYTLANDEQLKFFPVDFMQARANLVDHQIGVIADVDPTELQQIDAAKIFMARNAKKAYRDWLTIKELKGKFTWTIALWGVEAKAQEVGLTLEEYWQQIIKGCFLDAANPIQEWQKVTNLQKEILAKLNALPIDHLEVKGKDVDLSVKLGPERKWLGGSGRNIPSFECFTSPDWRGVSGWVRFSEPLYRYGNIIKNVFLKIEKGLVIEAKAEVGNEILQEMLKTPNADKIGEFSLTDKRTSHITHAMAETLFDENVGGPFGNMHLAIGMSYRDCYQGDPSQVTEEQWLSMGYNDSAEHTDIVSTVDRTVTAFLKDGHTKVIYEKGMFVL
jgi:aminopeptidase